jgi:hypothetical protein
MANIAPAAAKAMLDWCVLGADPVRPNGVYVGLSTVTPTSVSAYEIGPGSGYARQLAVFGAADTNHVDYSEAANLNGINFGPFSSAVEFIGFHLWNAQVAGQMLWYGSLMQGAAAEHGTARIDPGVVIVRLG